MKLLSTLVSLNSIAIITAFSAVNVYDSASNVYYLESSTDIDLTGGSGNFYFDFLDDGALPSSTSDTKLILNTSSTYTFTHVGSGHPFIILEHSFMSPFNPNTSTGLRDNFPTTLPEAAAYVTVSDSEPLYLVANIEDSFTWSPSELEIGSYWYTCAIAGHRDFLGQISVVPEPSSYALILGGLAFGLLVFLRRR